MDRSLKKGRRPLWAALAIAIILVGALTVTAGARPSFPRWWQYEKAAWTEGWRSVPKLVRAHRRWHRSHPRATRADDTKFHGWLGDRNRARFFHRAVSSQSGDAVWYDAEGEIGACGVPLTGLYAAHRTLPCEALVSVRTEDRYVMVRILDRGPFGSSTRIIDLSPRAFRWLAPDGGGVIPVTLVHLEP